MTKFKSYGREYALKLKRCTYAYSNTLAVIACTDEDGYDERFCDITVNIDWDGASDTMAFVDEPNCPGIGAWLVENGIAEPTGIMGYSGFNSYMLYKFSEKALIEMKELK